MHLLSKGYYVLVGCSSTPTFLYVEQPASSHFGILGSQTPADLPCMVRASALWLFPCCTQASFGKLMSCGILTTGLRLLLWFVAPLHRWAFISFLNMLKLFFIAWGTDLVGMGRLLSRLGIHDPWTVAQSWAVQEYDFPSHLLPCHFLYSFAALVV